MTGILLYPACLDQIFSGYRGDEAFSNLNAPGFGERLITYYKVLSARQFGGLFLILAGVCLLALAAAIALRAVKAVRARKKADPAAPAAGPDQDPAVAPHPAPREK